MQAQSRGPLEATYVLPLRRSQPAEAELTAYLLQLSEWLEVVVSDGSPPDVFAAHQHAWGDRVRQVPVKSVRLNGKVAGVIDGLAAAAYDAVVVADDDVRYDRDALEQVLRLLAEADAVVPQNYFDPLPWHARWDTGRSLLNRALGHDYAGTAALRRSALPSGEYCGSVLFENLEMLRTIAAAGGVVHHARGLYVRRLPPEAGHFWRQRFRQAYDSFAQPVRFAAELAVLPAVMAALPRRRGRRALVAGCLAVVGVAEIGRRRDRGEAVFSVDAALWAPAWLAERAVCGWAAVLWRLRGGVPYAGQRLRTAAHRESEVASGGCPQPTCDCHDQSGQAA